MSGCSKLAEESITQSLSPADQRGRSWICVSQWAGLGRSIGDRAWWFVGNGRRSGRTSFAVYVRRRRRRDATVECGKVVHCRSEGFARSDGAIRSYARHWALVGRLEGKITGWGGRLVSWAACAVDRLIGSQSRRRGEITFYINGH